MADWKYRPKSQEEREAEQRKQEPAEETPEGFFSKNVKTVTFFVCLGILLALIGPLSIFRIYQMYQESVTEGSVEMTEADLVQLSAHGASLKLEHITVFKGELGESDERITYHVNVSNYILFAVQNKSTKTLDFCILTDTVTGDNIDIRADDVQAFLASH